MKLKINSWQEFDIRLEDLINRLNKRHKVMNSLDYRKLVADIELFSMTFSDISEELRLKGSVKEILSTLEQLLQKGCVKFVFNKISRH